MERMKERKRKNVIVRIFIGLGIFPTDEENAMYSRVSDQLELEEMQRRKKRKECSSLFL